MSNRPLILVTNDDGIDSPGLRAAAEAVADLGDLLIIAPLYQQSGAGRSYPPITDKTIYPTEILVNKRPFTAYKVDMSPAQTVLAAIVELAPRPISLCISGINYGENIGSGITSSGTVGAAIEAACSGIPALAVSLETPFEFHRNPSSTTDFKVAAHFTRLFAQQTLAKGLPPRVDLLKIDIPASATPQTPWRMASVSRQRYYELKKRQEQAAQPTELEYQAIINHDTLEPESDVSIFAVEKMVAVVPMTVDLTAPVALAQVARFFNGTA